MKIELIKDKTSEEIKKVSNLGFRRRSFFTSYKFWLLTLRIVLDMGRVSQIKRKHNLGYCSSGYLQSDTRKSLATSDC